MIEKKLIVSSASGLHARSAQAIVQEVNKHQAEIKLINENAEADAASILELMMLAAAPGSTVVVRADGSDEQQAVAALEELFNNNFNKEPVDGI